MGRSKKVSGIYAAFRKGNDSAYVGQASNIKQRMRDHRFALRHNKHKNKHFQNAWNLYGEDAFEFVVLEVIENANDNLLYEREKYWFDYYTALNYNMYNIAPIEKANRGIIRTPEIRDKIRQSTLAQLERDPGLIMRMAEANVKDWPPFVDADGNVYNIRNLSKFCKERNISKSNMAKMLQGAVKFAYGYRLLDFTPKYNYTIVGPDGTIYSVDNMTLFADQHGLNRGDFYKVCSGTQKHSKGYRLYVEEYKQRYRFLDSNGLLVEGECIRDICKLHAGIIEQGLYRLVSGKLKKYKGWTLYESEN